jgi:ubiquinone/menaquinone biosynthesis C-methylase UbiE
VVSRFDRGARAYDLQLWLERAAHRVAARAATPAAGARVVDLAAGTGALARALQDRDPGIGTLTLVDGSPRMLERARVRLGDAATVRTIVADVRDVPLPDGSADLVSIGYLLHLLDPRSRARVLAEARRLLEPGGRLIVVVHASPAGRPGRVHRRAWSALSRLVPGGLVGQGPMSGVDAVVEEAGFFIDTSRTVPGVYWSRVVAAHRPSR